MFFYVSMLVCTYVWGQVSVLHYAGSTFKTIFMKKIQLKQSSVGSAIKNVNKCLAEHSISMDVRPVKTI